MLTLKDFNIRRQENSWGRSNLKEQERTTWSTGPRVHGVYELRFQR